MHACGKRRGMQAGVRACETRAVGAPRMHRAREMEGDGGWGVRLRMHANAGSRADAGARNGEVPACAREIEH